MLQAVDGDHPGGAVFFGVCRGKLSEGIDFADKHGRMVHTDPPNRSAPFGPTAALR
jgi:hypothetical protein